MRRGEPTGRQPEIVYAFTPREWNAVAGEHTLVPGEQALQAERPLREAVTDVKRRLTPRQRAVLRSSFGLNNNGKGQSPTEIAAELNISRSTVRTHKARALEKLRHPVRRAPAPRPERVEEISSQAQQEDRDARYIDWAALKQAALASTSEQEWDAQVDTRLNQPEN